MEGLRDNVIVHQIPAFPFFNLYKAGVFLSVQSAVKIKGWYSFIGATGFDMLEIKRELDESYFHNLERMKRTFS